MSWRRIEPIFVRQDCPNFVPSKWHDVKDSSTVRVPATVARKYYQSRKYESLDTCDTTYFLPLKLS